MQLEVHVQNNQVQDENLKDSGFVKPINVADNPFASSHISRRNLLTALGAGALLLTSLGELNAADKVNHDSKEFLKLDSSTTSNSASVNNTANQSEQISAQASSSISKLFFDKNGMSLAIGVLSTYAVTFVNTFAFYNLYGGRRLGFFANNLMFASVLMGSGYIASFAPSPSVGIVGVALAFGSLITLACMTDVRKSSKSEEKINKDLALKTYQLNSRRPLVGRSANQIDVNDIICNEESRKNYAKLQIRLKEMGY